MLLHDWVELYEPAAKRLLGQLEGQPLDDIHVTLLLDHSGSLLGTDSCLLAASAGIFSECLDRLGISHEILAFTTCSWRGGQSYKDWLAAGSPIEPGRVCDLLHIVYRSAQATGPVSFEALEQMTNPGLLKENVDGEAIEWALRRMAQHRKARNVLFVFSDGAPVDDRTLMLNGPRILDDHLQQTARRAIVDGAVELYGLGIGYAMYRYYPQYAVIIDEHDIGEVALPVLGAVLASNLNAPTGPQLPQD
jgi:cobaltochelatase CobT